MADFKNLIDIDDLAIFKNQADLLYATQATTTGIANRVTTLENAGADDNTIETIKVNGSALTPDANKAVDISVPTKVSDLTIDGNVVTDASYVHTDNNYTTADKNKLTGIAAGAQVNVIEGITIGGTDAQVVSKKVALGTAATATTESSLSNGSNLPTGAAVISYITGLGYQTATDVASIVEAYGYQTATDIATAVEAYGYQTATDVSTALTNSGYQANVIEGITIGGTAATPTNKVVALGSAAGASTASSVGNNSNLPTGAAVITYVGGLGYITETAIDTKIANAVTGHLTKQVVNAVPAANAADENVLYYVMNSSTNYYDIYQKIGNEVVRLDDVSIDLSGYAQSSQFSIATTAQVQTLFSGSAA